MRTSEEYEARIDELERVLHECWRSVERCVNDTVWAYGPPRYLDDLLERLQKALAS